MPKIVSMFFRPSAGLRRDFNRKCKRLGLTQNEVLISLASMWERGKVKVPQEG